MGCGKSSVGKLLAKQSTYEFVDTDAMIEQSEGESIDTIFTTKGESYFRILEEKTVHWLKENTSQSIISTGGGMLVYCEALKEVGKVVYLKVPFEVILARMSDLELSKRPLFKDKEKAQKMYEERDLIYTQKADVIIDANTSLEDVLLKLSYEIKHL